MSLADLTSVSALVILVGGAGLVLLFERAFPADERAATWLAVSIALGASAAASIGGAGDDGLGGTIRRDGPAVFFTTLIALATAGALIIDADKWDQRRGTPLVFTLLAAAGAVLMVTAADLLLMFVSMEIVFMALLALIVVTRSPYTRPAARSFFTLVGSGSALFAAGVGLVWSESGSFGLGGLASLTSPAGLAGIALLLVGLACLAGLAPFHFWTTPVLQATASPATAFVAIVPRLAAFAALMRCAAAITANAGVAADWRACVAILAAATLIAGGLGALTQVSLRRLLASLATSVSGQLALAVAAGASATTALSFAAAGYAVVMLGIVATLAAVPQAASIEELRGSARRAPLLVAALAVLMLGLAGLPPTGGFLGRLGVFEAAAGAQLAWLAFLAALATVASAAGGARVIFACFDHGASGGSVGRLPRALAITTAILGLALGVLPRPLLEVVQSLRF